MEDALARARAELEGVKSSLVREAALHAMHRTTASQEHQRLQERLDAATVSAEAPSRALAEICKWLDIDLKMHPAPEDRLEAILSAIDLQQTTHRRFVHHVEEKFTSLYAKLIAALYEVHIYRETYPDASFAPRLERPRPEFLEQAEAQAKKTMAKLTELVAAKLERSDGQGAP